MQSCLKSREGQTLSTRRILVQRSRQVKCQYANLWRQRAALRERTNPGEMLRNSRPSERTCLSRRRSVVPGQQTDARIVEVLFEDIVVENVQPDRSLKRDKGKHRDS